MFSKRSNDAPRPRPPEGLGDSAPSESSRAAAPKRRPPPPPRPGAASAKAARPGPKIKPKPLDSLNVDLTDSHAPPKRSVVENAAGELDRRREAVEEMVEYETPMVQRDPEEDIREIARRKAAEVTEQKVHGLEDRREGFSANKGRGKLKAKEDAQPAAAVTRGDQDRESMQSQAYYDLKSEIFEALIDAMDMGRIVSLPRSEAENEISQIVNEIVAVKGHIMSIAEQKRLVEDICDDVLGYGPLEPLLERDDIADIMVNGAEQVYIEVGGKIELTNIRFRDNRQLLEICQRMVSKVGRRVDESSPICDARLLDGSRVNVIAPPLAIDGATLTIRKFKKDKLKLSDLIKFGALTDEAARVLQIAAASRCNILISGGTGSGKTTLLNCLSGFAADDERIITCEDSAELQLQQPHVVRLETRPANLEGKGEVSMRDLVKNCLRMRPERIIVGEVRGPEAFDLLQAMNTGHDGSMGTLHANSPREGLSRLESMITMGGFALPSKTIREMIVSAVNVVVQAQRLRDGSRRITHISEVLGMEGETIITQDLVRYKVTGEDKNGRLIGERARGFNREVELQDALASMEEVVD